MKIYVVIPHYIFTDELVTLASNAIKSFKNTADVQIISVDDDSPMDTTFLKELSDVYIRKERGGFAKTCNAGFQWILDNVKEDCWVVCANNDIEVYPKWFERLKHAIELGRGSMVGGLGFRDKTIWGMPIEEYENNPQSNYNHNYITEGGRLDDWLMPGGFWMSTKKDLEEVGLFDENFEHGGYEDVDLFLRFKNAGKRLIMTPKVQYWHKEGATRYTGNERAIQKSADEKNFNYFINKWKFNQEQNILHFLVDNRINL